MNRIRLFSILLLALFAFVAPCRGQVADTLMLPSWPQNETSVATLGDSVDVLSSDDSLMLLRQQIDALNSRLDSNHAEYAALRNHFRNMVALKDSLVYLNDLYQKELQEKNHLMSEQVTAMQEKERLLAEKEELYRQALTSSSIDRAKWEGDLKAKEASIEAKSREIDYLQKDIDSKEVTLKTQHEKYENVLTEKERYRHLVDSLQKCLTAIEIENIRKEEENKYLQQRVKDAEAKTAITLNKKKKVRPIQGIAMRLFRTPNYNTYLSYAGDDPKVLIGNKNAGDIEFDFVTGASVMLWDLSDFINNKKDTSIAMPGPLPEIRRFDQKFNYDLGIYVGFGGSNLFKNFYIGPSFRFVDFFYLVVGVNVCEYEILKNNLKEGDELPKGAKLDDVTAKSWLVKPFIALSIDLDFLSYIKK